MSDIKAVIIQCGQEEYALPVETVVSIEKLERVNPIPHLPEYMLGLMRIRGELVPILDFQQILYGNSAKDDPNAKVVVVQTENPIYRVARSGCKRDFGYSGKQINIFRIDGLFNNTVFHDSG